MIKINLRGLMVLVVVLAVIDLGVAYGLSPLAAKMAQSSMSLASGTKIDLGTVRFHPLLLSLTLKDVQIRDPKNPEMRIFRADSASAQLDIVALLKKEIVFSNIIAHGAKVELIRDASGKFNVETLGQEDKGQVEGLIDKAKTAYEKRDWFGKAYDSWRRSQKKKAERKQADKVLRTNARQLPRGSVVAFRYGPEFVFRAGKIRLENADIVLVDKGQRLPPFRNVDAEIRNLAITAQGQLRFTGFELKGIFEASRKGEFDIRFSDKEGGAASDISIRLKDLDLAPLRPFYEKSLPVSIAAGYLELDSKTHSTEAALQSVNKLKLADYRIEAKKDWNPLAGAPIEAIVAALNRRPSFELDFEIGGTPDKPTFTGFRDALMKLVGQDLKGLATEGLKEKAGAKVAELSEKIKGLF